MDTHRAQQTATARRRTFTTGPTAFAAALVCAFALTACSTQDDDPFDLDAPPPAATATTAPPASSPPATADVLNPAAGAPASAGPSTPTRRPPRPPRPPDPPAVPDPPDAPDPDDDDGGDVYYANCAAARRAGAAPLRRGEPGYRRALDRDNDGVACDQ